LNLLHLHHQEEWTAVNKVFAKLGVVALVLALASPGFAATRVLPELDQLALDFVQFADDFVEGEAGGGEAGGNIISAREASDIAKSTVPGAKVLKVKYLPSGVYAVTLKGKGKLTRVMVDASTGNIR
jgi:hypothetical protein